MSSQEVTGLRLKFSKGTDDYEIIEDLPRLRSVNVSYESDRFSDSSLSVGFCSDTEGSFSTPQFSE